MSGKLGNPGADGYLDGHAGKTICLHHSAQLFRHFHRIAAGCLRHQNGELLAPITADHVNLTNLLTENTGHLTQHFVAEQVSKLVVETFEVVDVDHDDGQVSAVARCTLDFRADFQL